MLLPLTTAQPRRGLETYTACALWTLTTSEHNKSIQDNEGQRWRNKKLHVETVYLHFCNLQMLFLMLLEIVGQGPGIGSFCCSDCRLKLTASMFWVKLRNRAQWYKNNIYIISPSSIIVNVRLFLSVKCECNFLLIWKAFSFSALC